MSSKAKPLSGKNNKLPQAEPVQPQPVQGEDKPIEIPADILKILNTNYQIPQISEDEDMDEEVPEITLDIAAKPLIRRGQDEPPAPQEDEIINETTVEDYLKNTLSQLNLVKTLNQFQSEYLEVQQSGGTTNAIAAAQFQNRTTSQLIAENMQLKFELEQMRIQNERVLEAAQQAKDQFIKLRKQRDYHRHRHRQAQQERQTLVNDLRRLREHCQLYQPLILELNARYDKLLRNKQLSDMQKERAQNETRKLQMALQMTQGEGQLNGPVGINERGGVMEQTAASLAKQTQPFNKTAENTITRQQHVQETSYPNPFIEPECTLQKYKFTYTISSQQGRLHEGAISSVSFHRSRQVVATASADGSFKALTTPQSSSPNQLLLRGQPHSSYITCCRFNPASNCASVLASCAGDGTALLFDVASQAEIGKLSGGNGQLWGLDWHCAGAILALGGSERAVRLYDVNVGKALRSLEAGGPVPLMQPFASLRGPTRAVQSIQFQYAGNLLAFSSADGITKVYDIRQQTAVSQLTLKASACCAFDLSGQLLACGDSDGGFLVQDLRSGRALWRTKLPTGATCVRFDSGRSLIAGTRNGLYLVREGQAPTPVTGTEGASIECLDLNTVDGGFAAGTSDGSLLFVK